MGLQEYAVKKTASVSDSWLIHLKVKCPLPHPSFPFYLKCCKTSKIPSPVYSSEEAGQRRWGGRTTSEHQHPFPFQFLDFGHARTALFVHFDDFVQIEFRTPFLQCRTDYFGVLPEQFEVNHCSIITYFGVKSTEYMIANVLPGAWR